MCVSPLKEQDLGDVTLRETYTLIDSLRKELLAEVKSIHTAIEAKLVAHAGEHDAHDGVHERDRDKRNSLIRWAVTSVLTGIGVISAIIIAVVKS